MKITEEDQLSEIYGLTKEMKLNHFVTSFRFYNKLCSVTENKYFVHRSVKLQGNVTRKDQVHKEKTVKKVTFD